MQRLEELQFDNIYATLPTIFYSRHQPAALDNQFLIHFNKTVADMLGIDPGEAGRQDLVDLLTMNKPMRGFEPIAMCYAGHQFGQYVPRLGDGRAILLGQLLGEDNRRWDLQLKGAGRTLYSRQGDGKAVLRSTIREHLCSAAMHGLGIPTTHSLAMFGSDEEVYRERIETGAMLIRVAPSHIRFGSFEYFFYTQRHDDLKTLADFTLQHYFPELSRDKEGYLGLLIKAIESTAALIASWQSVGFCHGVMNSDNMSI
ncbi:MAG: protein adenylyltransferase SelO family protein, partial [bacterium]